jgi:ATP-binding cassette, subfamily B, bacterial PglK
MLIKFWRHLSFLRKKQSIILLILMIVASLMEVVSIGAVIPFLGVLTSPEYVYQHQLSQPLIDMLGVSGPSELILPLTIMFIIAILSAGLVRLLLLYVMIKVSFAIGADLSIDIYRKTLYQKYSVHIARNSSEIINGIITKTNTVISGVLTPVMTLLSSSILFLGITSALLIINTKAALLIFTGFGFLYLGVIYYTREKLKENSQCISEKSNLMIKSLQEGLGGIRDVLLDGSQEFYCKLYRDSDLPLRQASGSNQFISGSPRYIVESLGMVFIIVIAYKMTQGESGTDLVIPMLGALALGAQRLLPAVQQSYSAYTNIKGSEASFKDVIDLLDQNLPVSTSQSSLKAMDFEKSIKIEKVGFSYMDNKKWVLKDLNLEIPRGACVGFIGETGSGKSTLIDIIMGLITPTCGHIFIDNIEINESNTKSWQSHIAHVPQNIFLSDGTIEENIALGVSKENIDHQKVKKAARQAQISKIVENLEFGYQSLVGESGVRLSGGQRQRIGIARALYKESDVLIFDEATSSLDNETESRVMKSIATLHEDLTILIIAHRLSTLKNCDFIVEIKENGIIKIIKYEDIDKF